MISYQFTRYPHLTPMHPPRITQLNYELISLHQSSPPPLTSPPRPSPFQIQSHPFPISWPRTRAWGHPGAKGLIMLGHDGQGSDKQQQQLRLYRYQVVPYHTCSIDTRAQVVGMWQIGDHHRWICFRQLGLVCGCASISLSLPSSSPL